MTSLQGPGSQNNPDPYAGLLARLDQMRRELNDLTSSVLKSGGIRVSPDGMTIESSLSVDGALDVSGDASFSGDTTIGGNAAITGTLSLPAGIIDNEALANPVVLRSDYATASGFGTPNSAWLELCSVTITVPAGFTEMQFGAIGTALTTNSTGATHYLFVRVTRQINGVGTIFEGIRAQATIPSLYTSSAVAPYLWNEPVTPGDAHRFGLEVWTSAAFAADPNHYGRLDVPVTFTR